MKLLKFETAHCVQCKGLEMRMKGFDAVPVERVDCESDDERVDKYGIRNVPTLMLVDDDETAVYGQWGNVGSMSEITDAISKLKDGD